MIVCYMKPHLRGFEEQTTTEFYISCHLRQSVQNHMSVLYQLISSARVKASLACIVVS